MAKRHADPETLDHIIELRNKLAEAERQRDNALEHIYALHLENRQLKTTRSILESMLPSNYKYKVFETGTGDFASEEKE